MNERIEFDTVVAPGPAQAARIQQAIDRVHASGGGRASVGNGAWTITTVFLRSGVELHLEPGAVLTAFHDITAYPRLRHGVNNKDQAGWNLIAAESCERVALTGDGTIDGQDTEFWDACEGEADRPYGIFRFKPKAIGSVHQRPSPLIEFTGCREVRIEGVHIRRSPGWTLHVFNCDHVSVHNVTIRNHRYGPHTDGIGINCSRDVRVTGCFVDTGDDAIIIKATNAELRCERVAVTGCVARSNCAALGLGAETAGGIRDVTFTGCVAGPALRMIQIEMWDEGFVERAVFSGITGMTMPDEGVENERVIYVDIQQSFRKEPWLGHIRDLVFSDIVCQTRGRILMTAQDGSRIDGVTIRNVLMRVPEVEDPQTTVPRARSFQLSNFSPQTRAARAAVVADNVDRLTLRDVEVVWPADARVPMHALCLRSCPGPIIDAPRLRPSGTGVSFAMVDGAERGLPV